MSIFDIEKQGMPTSAPPHVERQHSRWVRRWARSTRQQGRAAGVLLMVVGTMSIIAYLDPSRFTYSAPEVHPVRYHDLPPESSLLTWAQDMSSSSLLKGLTPSFPQPNRPVTKDTSFYRGPATYSAYTALLDEFVSVVMPHKWGLYRVNQEKVAARSAGWDGEEHRTVWQTAKDASKIDEPDLSSWREAAHREKWDWNFNTDIEAARWVEHHLNGTRFQILWDKLPNPVLRSDLFRYLVLAIHGGVYSDADTKPNEPAFHWGQGVEVWRGGEGWMTDSELKRLSDFDDSTASERDEAIDNVLGRPNVLVSVAFDQTDREDWTWRNLRPIELVQWSMAATPYHPILLTCLLRTLQNTAKKVDFSQDHYARYKAAASYFPLGNFSITTEELEAKAKAEAMRLSEINVLNEPDDGGMLGIIEWTGPGVWTDAVFAYLSARYDMNWRELHGLTKPLRVGDVLILPQFTEHHYAGSWKDGSVLGP